MAKLPPLRKALIAHDIIHKHGLILLGVLNYGLCGNFLDAYKARKEKLMEITRILYPQTKGKHPCDDAEANRCLQQVIRWTDKIEKLIQLVDT